ncbi:MAG: 4-hydroxythreonine-4-phosphate dehydrogenase PdxA [Porphyromonadaceae bacterium CG2_30_38_12]|nr:MAG: 4-hydroxythreonine-4-phosphate dehydrogenase PdxA [Porphyromonadaceae bacterium CG2_30_38_12]
MEKDKLVIGITHGDINGIGYEVLLKTLAEPLMLETFIPVIYGSSKIAAHYRKALDLQSLNLNIIPNVEALNPKKVNIIHCVDDELKLEVGISTVGAGKASLAALQKATEDLKRGALDALVTAPINKNNIQSDQFHFPGHTEYLEENFGTGTPALMLLMNDVMRIAVVTGHIPVAEVSKAISIKLIKEKLLVFNNSLKKDFTIIRPRIAVLGLNPHAGDNGVIGTEEQTIIVPALKEAEKDGVLCFGPYAADGFFGSGHFNKFDGILAMYHDQGLIPFKTIAMNSGVNFTAGLSIIRTSPDHGTAYDIAGKNIASEESFRQAMFAAYDIYQHRESNKLLAANPLKIEPHRNERSNRIE